MQSAKTPCTMARNFEALRTRKRRRLSTSCPVVYNGGTGEVHGELTSPEIRSCERRAKGDIAIHGGRLEDLGSHRFLVLGPIHVGDPPCLDLPERRLAGSAIT